MPPRYERRTDFFSTAVMHRDLSTSGSDAAHEDAAAAIRAAEIEAVQPTTPPKDTLQLENMSIDELRKLAAELDVPDRAQIIEQDELIAAIRERL